jgi:hypothetical protein
VLVWCRGSRYIVTAAHTREMYPDRRHSISTFSGWVELDQPFLATSVLTVGREKDPVDLAFCRVDEGFAARLNGCEFLTASQIGFGDSAVLGGSQRSSYVTLGYPQKSFVKANRGKLITTTELSAFGLSSPASPTKYRQAKLDESRHVALEFNGKHVMTNRGLQRYPDMDGISGGGMFRLPSDEERAIGARPRLSAIVIAGQMSQQLIVGLRIDTVLDVIRSGQAALAVGPGRTEIYGTRGNSL